nr:hypothetical protein Iba_chr02bCG18900 [Ipomoea batatas]
MYTCASDDEGGREEVVREIVITVQELLRRRSCSLIGVSNAGCATSSAFLPRKAVSICGNERSTMDSARSESPGSARVAASGGLPAEIFVHLRPGVHNATATPRWFQIPYCIGNWLHAPIAFDKCLHAWSQEIGLWLHGFLLHVTSISKSKFQSLQNWIQISCHFAGRAQKGYWERLGSLCCGPFERVFGERPRHRPGSSSASLQTSNVGSVARTVETGVVRGRRGPRVPYACTFHVLFGTVAQLGLMASQLESEKSNIEDEMP